MAARKPKKALSMQEELALILSEEGRQRQMLTAVVDKARAGAVEHLPVARVPNLVAALKELKDNGVWIYGTDADASGELWQIDMKGPICQSPRNR